MKIITTVATMQTVRRGMKGTVALVPTMGYLHEGHISLVRSALLDNDHVIVSIFINPTQFGPGEDLARYPRNVARDLQTLRELSAPEGPTGKRGVSVAFVPTLDEVYPAGFDEWVEVTGPLTERLEGAHRPGHFRGVTTVVARLFRIIRPRRAYFGQKDAQQLRVIRRMVEDIHSAHPDALEGRVDVVSMPTVREPDGLAMSSRNVYLSPEEREAALAIPRALVLARRLVMDEGETDAEKVRQAVRSRVETPRRGVSTPCPALDYVTVADERTLEELETIDRPALVLLAARVGATRLIDNTIVVPNGLRVPQDLRPLLDSDVASLPAHPEVSKE
jgi:pantoate--beta-alanine ligase